MTNATPRSLGSKVVESERGGEDDGPFFSWLPPEDRLWRHPSEVPSGHPGGTVAAGPRRPKAISEALNNFAAGPGRIWTIALIAGLVGATAASGIGMMTGAFDQQTTVLRSFVSSSPEVSLAATGQPIDWPTVDNSLAPSVVSISVDSDEGPVVGSGLILKSDDDGDAYVITDRSLFDPADSTGYLGRIEVTFQSGGSVRGRLFGQDPLSGLALIEVPAANAAIPDIGSVADIHAAEPVMAMAGPASPDGTVFTGSISAEDQTIPLTEGTDRDNLVAVGGGISSSAAGGPLVDQWGQVVGIAVSVDPLDTAGTNLSFAVPIDEVERLAGEMLAGQRTLSHPWLGVTDSSDIPSATARQLGLAGGARAGQIMPGSPASQIGMSPGDIITSFDGHPIDSAGSLVSALYNCQPGSWATISYVGLANEPVTTRIEVDNEPQDS